MSDDAPIPAATVLLLRDAPQFEVLMVQRHADIGFAGGAMVFPGGRIDPGDRNPAWADCCDGLNADDPPRAAAMIAALREAFEETGVLLARDKAAGEGGALIDGPRAAALGAWRKSIEADDCKFLEMVKEQELVLCADRLRLFARWVAPPGLHRRFDTWFFAAQTPAGQEAREDGDETTEAVWIAPRDAVAARASGARRMIFPTARNIELLAESRSCDEALGFCAARRIEPIQPRVVKRGGVAYLTIPDGLGYPVTAELLETALRQ